MQLTQAERMALGVAAAQAIRANLPVDGFGDGRRLKDYADIWGVVARNAVLMMLDELAAVRESTAHTEDAARRVGIEVAGL